MNTDASTVSHLLRIYYQGCRERMKALDDVLEGVLTDVDNVLKTHLTDIQIKADELIEKAFLEWFITRQTEEYLKTENVSIFPIKNDFALVATFLAKLLDENKDISPEVVMGRSLQILPVGFSSVIENIENARFVGGFVRQGVRLLTGGLSLESEQTFQRSVYKTLHTPEQLLMLWKEELLSVFDDPQEEVDRRVRHKGVNIPFAQRLELVRKLILPKEKKQRVEQWIQDIVTRTYTS